MLDMIITNLFKVNGVLSKSIVVKKECTCNHTQMVGLLDKYSIILFF